VMRVTAEGYLVREPPRTRAVRRSRCFPDQDPPTVVGGERFSSGRVPGNSGGGGWLVPVAPMDLGMATGKRLASLSSTSPNSMPVIRSERRRAPDAASGTGPSIRPERSAAFGRKCRVSHHVARSGSTYVIRGSRSHRCLRVAAHNRFPAPVRCPIARRLPDRRLQLNRTRECRCASNLPRATSRGNR